VYRQKNLGRVTNLETIWQKIIIMICLQICPVFGVNGRRACQIFNVCGVSDVRHSGERTTEPLTSKPSAYEVEMAI
jgi:hypothetical protein